LENGSEIFAFTRYGERITATSITGSPFCLIRINKENVHFTKLILNLFDIDI